MAVIALPEVEVRCYPLGALPQRAQEMFSISDVFADLIRRNWTDYAEVDVVNPTLSQSWASQPEFAAIDENLAFVRFYKDGTFSEGAVAKSHDVDGDEDLAGFVLKARDGFLDCKAGFTSLDTAHFDSLWETLQGDWETVIPPSAPERTRIMNSGADVTAKARTIGTIAANRSIRLDVRFMGMLSGDPLPGWRFMWGKAGRQYSLVMRHGLAPTIERDIGQGWTVLRRLDGIKSDLANGEYLIRLRRLAGRLCITINEHNYYLLELETYSSRSQPRPVDVVWDEAPWQVNCHNCRMAMGAAIIKYADSDDTPYLGEFTRSVPRATFIDEGGAEEPEVLSSVNGWARDGAQMSIFPELVDGAVNYTCMLVGSSEGRDTPFLTKASVSYNPVWEAESPGYLNLRQALEGMRVTLAMPPLAAGASVVVEVDRKLLSRLNSNWQNYVGRYHPVEIRVRRRFTDGSADNWTNLFKGYIYQIQKSNTGYNEEKMVLTLRDPIIRLQRHGDAIASVIDHRFPPLDLLIENAAGGFLNVADFRYYGGQAIKEILSRCLGPDEAEVLNGDGDINRFFNHHYPLFSIGDDTGGIVLLQQALSGRAPTTNSWMFPPPFGEPAISWIDQIAEFDRAIFFYGWPDGNTSIWPVPIYGRILNITAGRPTYVIPDREYVSGDLPKVAKSMETETRPDKDVNRVLAWDNGGLMRGGLAGVFPAMRMAEARLPADDINAAELSWERTYVMRDDLFFVAGSAEAVAMGLIEELSGRLMQFPKITFRGMPFLQAWDKIQIKADGSQSDTTLGLDGLTFRAERIEHSFDFRDGSTDPFLTDAWLRPLSASGF